MTPVSDTDWQLTPDSRPRRGWYRYTRTVVFPEGTPRGVLVEFVTSHRGQFSEAQVRIARVVKNKVSFYVTIDSGD